MWSDARGQGTGNLLVLSAPSGTGKTTLVKALLARDPSLRFSISHTTRAPRPGEVDGRDYVFLDRSEFQSMADRGEFLEHAEVFGNRYGTSRTRVAGLCAAGHDVLLEIDWQGAQQVRANGAACRTVFIFPPSVVELEKRLRRRGTDSEATMQQRLDQALADMSHWAEFDFLVVNGVLEEAVDRLLAIIRGAPPSPAESAAIARAVLPL